VAAPHAGRFMGHEAQPVELAGWLAGWPAGQPGAGRDKTKGSLLVAAAPAAKTLKDKRPAISR